MTRNGKIARMPYDIREELNRRLRDGKSGPALLKWLNEDPECGEVLDEEFDGRPITKQNLSEWKQGGYKEWLRKEEARQRVQVLTEKAEDLENDAGASSIADRVATLLEVELVVAMEQLDEIKDTKERWARLKEISRELYRLRREDHHARKLRMAEEQYQQREKEAEKEKLLKLQAAMKNKPIMASIDGNSDAARNWADWVICVGHGLPMPIWWTNPQTAEEWSELMMPYWLAKSAERKSTSGQSPKSSECGARKEVPSVHPPSSDFGATRAPSVQRSSEDQDPKSTAARSQAESKQVGPSQTESDRVQVSQSKRVERPAEGQESCTETVREPAGETLALQGRAGPTESESVKPKSQQ